MEHSPLERPGSNLKFGGVLDPSSGPSKPRLLRGHAMDNHVFPFVLVLDMSVSKG